MLLDRLHKVAKSNQGTCLSKVYKTQLHKYKWKCKNNHVFTSTYKQVKLGSWCKECYLDSIRNGKSWLKILAKKNKGKLISKTYVNNKTKYFFKCEKKHTFRVRANDAASKGYWCPYCRNKKFKSKPEREIFYYLKNKTTHIFSNIKGLLKYKRLELDIFIPFSKIGPIAIEYDSDYWHSHPTRIKLDKLKTKLCKSAGIYLIRIKESKYLKNKSIIDTEIVKYL